jgi:hypothetical protein
MKKLLVVLLATMGMQVAAIPAFAGDGNQYFVANSNATGYADVTFKYGSADDAVVIGDWDGDGLDTITVRRGNKYYISNTLMSGFAEKVVTYGLSTDQVLAGDWDGDGTDSLALRRGATIYFDNNLDGNTDSSATFSGLGQQVFSMSMSTSAGTPDSVGSRRDGNEYCGWATTGGPATLCFRYGRSSDTTYIGDWDGDGADTIVVRRDNTYHVKNDYQTGYAEYSFKYGRASDVTLSGDWDADGIDTLTVRRNAVVRPGTNQYVAGSDFQYGVWKSTSTAAGCYWERTSDFSGSFDALIANGFYVFTGPVTVQVFPGDAGFNTNRCGAWERIYSTDSITMTSNPGPGHWRVGIEIPAGTYKTTVPSGDACYWERLSGFSGEFADTITNDYVTSGQVIVAISSSDAGFFSDGCGTWSKQ